MNEKLIKKLLINALNELSDCYSNNSCNDLIVDSGILEGVSKKELSQIEKHWQKFFPDEAEELDGEMLFDTQLVETLIKLLKT